MRNPIRCSLNAFFLCFAVAPGDLDEALCQDTMIRYPTPFLKLFYAFLLFLAGTHVASFIKASYVVDFLHHDVTPGSPSLSRDQKGHGLFAPFNPPPPAKTRAQMIVDRRKNKQDPLKPFKPYQPTIHMAPETLEQRALQQFDALRKKGSLFWDDNPPQIVKGQPFDVHTIPFLPHNQRFQLKWIMQFQFRFASSMAKKPYLPPSDPGRSTSTNAFTDDDPLFRLESIGSQHLLILNKFCIVRPMLLLHTASFVPQSDALNEGDLAAAWEVLGRMDTPQMVIYNCGANAGSSQGHKHLQIFPSPEGDGFRLWPGLGIDEG